jgi:hypothetical protein
MDPPLEPALPAHPAHFRKAIHDTYYESYFQELMCGSLGSRWATIDLTAAVLVAVTASGSAFAGLALWNTSSGRPYWAAIALTSSIVALIHGVFHVAERVKIWTDLRRTFVELRIQLETLLLNMDIDGPLDEQRRTFKQFRDRYATLVADAPNDMANTISLRDAVQDTLDLTLKRKGYVNGTAA